MAGLPSDKIRVTAFEQQAYELLNTALLGPSEAEMTVLIGFDGGLRLCVESDWPLDSLVREQGARTGYRVQFLGGTVRVEGREGLRTCVLESARPQTSLNEFTLLR